MARLLAPTLALVLLVLAAPIVAERAPGIVFIDIKDTNAAKWATGTRAVSGGPSAVMRECAAKNRVRHRPRARPR